MQTLIDQGHDVNGPHKNGETKSVLEYELNNHYLRKDAELLKILFAARGANVNTTNFGLGSLTGGQTAVHAICRGKIDASVLPVLIKAGADLTKVDEDGHPPAYYAREKELTEVLQLLKDNGVIVE